MLNYNHKIYALGCNMYNYLKLAIDRFKGDSVFHDNKASRS